MRFSLVLVSSFLSIGCGSGRQSNDPGYPESRQVVYAFTIANTTNRMVSEVRFRAFAPVRKTATQQCVSIISSHPHAVSVDEAGNQTLCFEFLRFPPHGRKVVSVNVDMAFSKVPNAMPETDMHHYLLPEEHMPIQHPEIRMLANRLERETDLETARAIFDWVSGNIRYGGYASEARGALFALRKREGDCTETMHLFAALCRAAGIPARCMAGYVCDGKTVLSGEGFHNWAEFFIEGKWRLADPQKRVFMERASNYLAVALMKQTAHGEPDRFTRFHVEGDGLVARMN
ncbi:MAG: transglutaminase domain-containing protein [Deltaproteobacteria bacterium]|nr:transglutaminase domain-containing protein [Deltaproteobacteria bacterium]